MYLVAIAWLYVALMMALAEAFHSQGTVLGAIVTFFLYGVGPLALVLYLMGAPARRRALRHRAAEPTPIVAQATSPVIDDSGQADQSRHAPGAASGDVITAVGKEK